MSARWKHFKTVCRHKAIVYRECKACGEDLSKCPQFINSNPKKAEEVVMSWAAEHPVVYPTWGEWFLTTCQVPLTSDLRHNDWEKLLASHIPADIAEKLGIEPK